MCRRKTTTYTCGHVRKGPIDLCRAAREGKNVDTRGCFAMVAALVGMAVKGACTPVDDVAVQSRRRCPACRAAAGHGDDTFENDPAVFHQQQPRQLDHERRPVPQPFDFGFPTDPRQVTFDRPRRLRRRHGPDCDHGGGGGFNTGDFQAERLLPPPASSLQRRERTWDEPDAITTRSRFDTPPGPPPTRPLPPTPPKPSPGKGQGGGGSSGRLTNTAVPPRASSTRKPTTTRRARQPAPLAIAGAPSAGSHVGRSAGRAGQAGRASRHDRRRADGPTEDFAAVRRRMAAGRVAAEQGRTSPIARIRFARALAEYSEAAGGARRADDKVGAGGEAKTPPGLPAYAQAAAERATAATTRRGGAEAVQRRSTPFGEKVMKEVKHLFSASSPTEVSFACADARCVEGDETNGM